MIRSKDILNCQPLLASVLGEQYGVQVHIGGKTACTNGRVIYLPSLPMDCVPKMLALAKGFTDHEAAHIRHTDFDALQAATLILLLSISLTAWRTGASRKSYRPSFPTADRA